jgi:hypothetical protein
MRCKRTVVGRDDVLSVKANSSLIGFRCSEDAQVRSGSAFF